MIADDNTEAESIAGLKRPHAYRVKELFLTVQGEGMNAGRPAVFLRFAGCNLWSGRESDRGMGPGSCSRWCDTDFVGGRVFRDTTSLAEEVARHWHGRFIVCTGGEPLLQLDPQLIAALHARGYEIAVETNGTLLAPAGIDWLCVSPKSGAGLVQKSGDELKLVYPQPGAERPSTYADLAFRHFLLQPMDGPERERNTHLAIQYCQDNPRWRLSTQTHKYLGVR